MIARGGGGATAGRGGADAEAAYYWVFAHEYSDPICLLFLEWQKTFKKISLL